MSNRKKPPKKDFTEAIAASQANGSDNDVHPPSEPVVRRRFKQKLPVRIDDAAVALLAEDMAIQFELHKKVEDERRDAMAGFRKRMAAISERMEQLAANVRSHTISKSVDCMDRLIAQTNTIESVRIDTGETFDTRAAKHADLQDSLNYPEAPPSGEELAGNEPSASVDGDPGMEIDLQHSDT